MTLYVDGMFFRCSGVGRLLENLLDALLERDRPPGILTLVPRARRDAFAARFPHPAVRPVYVDYGPMGARDLLLKGRDLRRLPETPALHFYPGHNVPLAAPRPYVLTVNDATVFSPLVETPAWRKAGFRLLLSRAIREAESVVTISEAAKEAILRRFDVPAGKVRVIYPWIGDPFLAPEAGAGDRGRALAGGEYVLYLGLRIAHKNVEGAVRAFLLLADAFPDIRLVVAGGRHRAPDAVDRWKRDPRLAGRLTEVVDPDDRQVRDLLAGARAFVFPSFVEGFGLPPLEAMASGTPVVCSDIPVFREVYGDAACYADPSRPESIAEALSRLLADGAHAAEMVRRGRDRVRRYRKEASIPAYLALLGIA